MAILFSISASIAALLFALFLALNIKKQKVESAAAEEISEIIKKGAKTFLMQEYKVLIFFVLIVFIMLMFLNYRTALAFLLGAFFSALAGNLGMRIATTANVRTAENCRKSFKKALFTAFDSGTVMGMSVVGVGLLGISVLYLIFRDPQIIYGFGMGASGIALFARVGGGIYTKAADVGADIVGKIEAGIPEDDSRNPATIADNVGDNVGDVAGMGADLLESYADSIIAAMVIGSLAVAFAPQLTVLPLILSAAGILASILGNVFVRFFSKAENPQGILNGSIWLATGFMVVFSYFVIRFFSGSESGNLPLFLVFLFGLFAGIAIGLVTEYYTSEKRKPVRDIAYASQTSAATNIIAGFALGLKSTLLPIIIIALVIFFSYVLAGIYGIALAAVGMLSTLGITLATNTYGPVADNAAGIAEMSKMGKEARERAEKLDAVGNTTAAIGKGFAIGSAALTSLALLVSYGLVVKLEVINLLSHRVIVGILLGGVLPFFFSAFAMSAVGRAAIKMVEEVRRQFKEIPGILEGTTRPEYEKSIAISTSAALREMVLPGAIAVLAPIVVGFLLGPEALGGLLVGAMVSGFLLAVLMANAGGAWDNAKKYIEAGNLGGKGSPAHKAAVIGDTVGDPFKDTAGPSLNILIKLISIIALIIAPLL